MTLLELSRENFANSKAGEESWETVRNNAYCKNCGTLAMRTVDFYLIGDP